MHSETSALMAGLPPPQPVRDEDDWRMALGVAQVMTIPPDTTIVRPGDPCRNFVLIEQGTVRVCQPTDYGRALMLHRVGAGEICIYTLHALIALIDYNVEIVSEGEVHIATVPQEKFYRCLAESDAFRRFVVGLLARRVVDLTQLVQKVRFSGLSERTACLLQQLFTLRNTRKLEVTHQALAEDLGSSREVISRLLKEFEQRGALRLQRGVIELLSTEVLAQLARSPIGGGMMQARGSLGGAGQ